MEKQRFREFLSAKGFKLTKERDEILMEVLSTREHFDPDELFVRLKTKGSKVSKASIYRTIPLLIAGGVIEEVERVEKHAHYEKILGTKHHDHMICVKCGQLIEFFSPSLETLQDELCSKKGFKVIRHTLEILGHCEKCSD
ncbi:MAG: Fur family transcriptional regulator [Dissulfurispiraceae bacterium]